LELLSQFDPFIAEHLKKFGNPGKGHTSYLSANICNDFINVMGKKVLNQIISEVKESKYYSISVDSTPDLTHVDQMTFIIRYVREGKVVERFLAFIPIEKHKGEYLATTVIEFLEKHDIDINNCRGQSYDNASNMAGQYSGLQARIKELCEHAIFVPCAAHSLNLILVHAAQCNTEATIFFQFIQNVYNFCSSSTYRWNTMKQFLGPNKLVAKSLSETRWSARASAVTALEDGYKEFIAALSAIAADEDQSKETRNEAVSICKKMQKLEIIILTEIWNNVLITVNKVNLSLQSTSLTMEVAVKLLKSLISFLNNERTNFEKYYSLSKDKFPDSFFKQKTQRKTERNTRIKFFDGPSEEVQFSDKEKFKIEVFFPIMDSLIAELNRRFAAYDTIFNRFGFLTFLKTISEPDLHLGCSVLAGNYSCDVNEKELELECIHLAQFLNNDEMYKNQECGLSNLYNILVTNKLEDAFPNISISLRIFLSLMITNCTGERSFSKLARIKNELRSSMLQERLNSLSLMCIENDTLLEINFDDIIDDFAHLKSRKKKFYVVPIIICGYYPNLKS